MSACGNPACTFSDEEDVLFFCSRCFLTPYHGEECQQVDFNRHNRFCASVASGSLNRRRIIQESIDLLTNDLSDIHNTVFDQQMKKFVQKMMKIFVLNTDMRIELFNESEAEIVRTHSDMPDLCFDSCEGDCIHNNIFKSNLQSIYKDLPFLCVESCGETCNHI
jgi:hypothetical protein